MKAYIYLASKPEYVEYAMVALCLELAFNRTAFLSAFAPLAHAMIWITVQTHFRNINCLHSKIQLKLLP